MSGRKKRTAGGSDVYAIHVKGDKHTQQEPSEHRIHFPGGYIGVTRTTDDEYWVHVGINREFDGDDEKIPGRLRDIRFDHDGMTPVHSYHPDRELEHLAIRVAPGKTWLRDGRPADYGK